MPGIFTEVVKPQRLRFTAFAEGLDGTRYLESDTIVTFEEQGGRTKLTVKASAKGRELFGFEDRPVLAAEAAAEGIAELIQQVSKPKAG
jgi:uncharacterized protein YndB with AHSA1/START domain